MSLWILTLITTLTGLKSRYWVCERMLEVECFKLTWDGPRIVVSRRKEPSGGYYAYFLSVGMNLIIHFTIRDVCVMSTSNEVDRCQYPHDYEAYEMLAGWFDEMNQKTRNWENEIEKRINTLYKKVEETFVPQK